MADELLTLGRLSSSIEDTLKILRLLETTLLKDKVKFKTTLLTEAGRLTKSPYNIRTVVALVTLENLHDEFEGLNAVHFLAYYIDALESELDIISAIMSFD